MCGRARPDALDQFSAQRDAQYEQEFAAESQYLDPSTIGYAGDLGQYGDWSNDGDNGPVWYPRAVPMLDWAPYSVGHWAYIAPWGWTWVEAEPWGFAPFHYGRWARFGPRWGWIPGPHEVRPVYSPALVVFVGGPRFSLSIGFGGRGGGGVAAWFPLGPREVYQPPYRTSTVYTNRINVTNIFNRNTVEVRNIYNQRTTNVYVNNVTVNNNVYVNRAVATTAVQQDHFAAGRPVRGSQVQVDSARLAQAPVQARPPSVPVPQRPVAAAPPPQGAPPVQKRPELSNTGAAATHPGFGPPRSFDGNRGGGAPQPNAPPQGVPAQAQEPMGARPTHTPPTQLPMNQPPARNGAQQPAPPVQAAPAPAPPQAPTQPGVRRGGVQGGGRFSEQPPVETSNPYPPRPVERQGEPAAPASPAPPARPAPAETPEQGVRHGGVQGGRFGEQPAAPPAVNPQSPYQPRPVQRPAEPAPQPQAAPPPQQGVRRGRF